MYEGSIPFGSTCVCCCISVLDQALSLKYCVLPPRSINGYSWHDDSTGRMIGKPYFALWVHTYKLHMEFRKFQKNWTGSMTRTKITKMPKHKCQTFNNVNFILVTYTVNVTKCHATIVFLWQLFLHHQLLMPLAKPHWCFYIKMILIDQMQLVK